MLDKALGKACAVGKGATERRSVTETRANRQPAGARPVTHWEERGGRGLPPRRSGGFFNNRLNTLFIFVRVIFFLFCIPLSMT